MGLDIDFVIPGEDTSLLSLRNHWEFFNLFAEQKPAPAHPGWDDMIIDLNTIVGVAHRLSTEMETAGVSAADIPQSVPDAFHDLDPDSEPWERRLPVYARMTRNLCRAVCDHGAVICAWSA